MQDLALAASTALWLGILTSIMPCPLATNILAVSYIGQRVDRTSKVLLAGLLYTLGRTFVYVALAVAILATALSVPQVSLFLQKYMHLALGPILIVVGMLLLGLIEFHMKGSGVSEGMQRRIDAAGIWGALLLGVMFALSFCPASAAVFFFSLIPLSLEAGSRILLPLLYGVGTALPVLVFAVLIAVSVQRVGKAHDIAGRVGSWARFVTGGAFLLVGIFYSLKYIFEIF